MIRTNGDRRGRFRALGVGGIVALSLHGLAFSFLQLRDLRRIRPQWVQSRDNTPELLQFSSQMAQAGPPREAAAPRIPQLPPPSRGASSALSLPRQERGPSSAGRVSDFSPSAARGTASVTVSRQGRGITVGKPKRMATDADRRKGRPAIGSPDPLLNESTTDWAAALARLQSLDPQEVPSREPPKGGAATAATGWGLGDGQAVVRLDPNSNLGKGYQALWAEASLQRRLPTRSGSGGSGAPVEVRRVSWRNVRAAELPIRHGQMLILSDKRFLLWLQDDQLYLLQAPSSTESRG